MSGLLEFEKSIKYTRAYMKLYGGWPSESGKNRSFVVAFMILFFILIPQTTKLYIVKNNLNDIIDVLAVGLLVCFVAFCKICVLWYKREGNKLWTPNFLNTLIFTM